MKTYVDTSVLVSLYIQDANSPKADAWRQANPVAIDFTSFHRIELRNALSLAVFQQRITSAEAQAAWQDVQQDMAAGLLVPVPDLWGNSFGKRRAWPNITLQRLEAAAWTFCMWQQH